MSIPFTLRFEARCTLCDFTTSLDVEFGDRGKSAEVVAVAAVLHAENVHGKVSSLYSLAGKKRR